MSGLTSLNKLCQSFFFCDAKDIKRLVLSSVPGVIGMSDNTRGVFLSAPVPCDAS